MNLSYSTYDITLPNPEFEDIRRFTSNSIKRSTPGGVLKTFKDSDWPVLETFVYTVRRLKQVQRDDFINLVNAAAGKPITLTDHIGAVRPGFIVTPVNEILTVRDDCYYDINFEFMATAITNITGDCHDDPAIDTPEPGDADYHRTIDSDDFYRIIDEADGLMYAEDDDNLWIEAY